MSTTPAIKPPMPPRPMASDQQCSSCPRPSHRDPPGEVSCCCREPGGRALFALASRSTLGEGRRGPCQPARRPVPRRLHTHHAQAGRLTGRRSDVSNEWALPSSVSTRCERCSTRCATWSATVSPGRRCATSSRLRGTASAPRRDISRADKGTPSTIRRRIGTGRMLRNAGVGRPAELSAMVLDAPQPSVASESPGMAAGEWRAASCSRRSTRSASDGAERHPGNR